MCNNIRSFTLEPLFNSKNKENRLLFLSLRGEGYTPEISSYLGSDISPIQNQLEKLENGNIHSSKLVGRTRVYTLNPRYPFLKVLMALLRKAKEFLPEEERNRLLLVRK
jgi:predicted transcriptional regulator